MAAPTVRVWDRFVRVFHWTLVLCFFGAWWSTESIGWVHKGCGYATLALNAAVRTLRDHEAVRFALLFCEPHNEAFYQARGWHAFKGEVHAEQPGGRIRFEAMAPYIFDFTRKPRDGIIDLCGLPW